VAEELNFLLLFLEGFFFGGVVFCCCGGGVGMGIWWNGLLYGLGGLACTGVVLLLALQEKLVYVPIIPGMSKGYPITPARLRLRYEDVWLESSEGVRLHSWFIKASPDCRGKSLPRRLTTSLLCFYLFVDRSFEASGFFWFLLRIANV
jgi:hypothetical protein